LVPYKDVIGTAGSVFGAAYYIVVAAATFMMGVVHNGTVLAMPLYLLFLSVVIMNVYKLAIHKGQED